MEEKQENWHKLANANKKNKNKSNKQFATFSDISHHESNMMGQEFGGRPPFLFFIFIFILYFHIFIFLYFYIFYIFYLSP